MDLIAVAAVTALVAILATILIYFAGYRHGVSDSNRRHRF